ncbi:FecR domain-containing protein [Azomonas macrocytogenes]|uniref:Transmembrane sensor n=1 Tax=Azomonas macrocytogenes TaxID=69962 RepID=A0A839SZ51_AZOMA|nr:FecR family protein [Azomonas macrocytogenes]MBB3101969.1 transmembrane sensor [Azomonas macrocytogenes]
MTNPVSEHIARQAIQWLIELQTDADEEQRRNWQRWREADPEHERAWQRIESVNQRLRGLSPQATRIALASRSPQGRRQVLKLLGLIAIAAPTGWLGYRQARPWLADYRTALGEHRNITLIDGSELSLNTDSAVDVTFEAGLRLLRLVRGEIQLQVAARDQPFLIDTTQGRLLTKQAHFNLRQYPDHCQLSVLAGTVQVRCAAHPERQASITAGQQMRFAAHQLGAPQPFEASLTAWRRGMLVAVNMRLADFLDELGRYHRGWLECDPRVADLRLSGTYPLANSQAIIKLLESTLPVAISWRTRYWVKILPKQA